MPSPKGYRTVHRMGVCGAGADLWLTYEIKSAGGRWEKDVKQVKISIEGADVEVTKVVLQWDNRRDDTVSNVGVLKSGGQTAPVNAPGRKGRLTAATIQYKILGDAPTATLKLWGFD